MSNIFFLKRLNFINNATELKTSNNATKLKTNKGRKNRTNTRITKHKNTYNDQQQITTTTPIGTSKHPYIHYQANTKGYCPDQNQCTQLNRTAASRRTQPDQKNNPQTHTAQQTETKQQQRLKTSQQLAENFNLHNQI